MHCFICIIIAIVASASARYVPAQTLSYFGTSITDPLAYATANVSMAILSDLTIPSYSSPSSINSNTFFSPLGVVSTLSLMRMCSSGKTREQFNRLPIFRLPGNVANSFNALHYFFTDPSIRESQPDSSELDNSNFVFLESTMDYSSKFVERAGAFNNLEVLRVNFSTQPEFTRAGINYMISTKTRGLIPQLFTPADVNSETQLVISNTVYFQGKWKQRFSPAGRELQYFHLQDGSTVHVPMMTQTYQYANHILCRTRGNNTYCGNSSIPDIIELPFRGDDRRMVIILPNQQVTSLEEIKTRFNSEIEKWRAATRKTFVTLTMPRFKLDYEVNLKQVLRNQGLANVFDSRTADFSDLSSTRPLRFTKFVHKTTVSVGQSGVTLAAGSGVIGVIRMTYSALARNSMVVNRPFLFFIEDIPTKMMVFLGQVNDPR